MAPVKKTHVVALSVIVLVLASQPLAAQSGQGSGTNTTGSSSAGKTSRSSRESLTPDIDLRNVILSGQVVIADGSPPPESVAVERVCGAKTTRMGYTDTKGFFSFPLVQTYPVMQDASENWHDNYNSTVFPPSLDSKISKQPEALPTLIGCELRGLLAGFQSTSVMIPFTYSLAPTNVGTIVLLRGEKQRAIVSATSMNVPKRARKAHEKAISHIKKHKLTEAQAELEKALKAYPQYAAAWTDLGWLHEEQNHFDEAREAFSQARAADDNFVPPYVGLASVAARQSKWKEVQELSTRAAQLDGAGFPVSFYYNALASFQLGELDNAEKSARLGERLDTRHSLPQMKLLLGSILARKQNYTQAAEELKLYLKVAPAAENAEKVRQRLAELERLSTSAGASAPPDLPSAVAVAPSPDFQLAMLTNWEDIARLARTPLLSLPRNWAPPDIDEALPFPVREDVPCSLPHVLQGASLKAKELVTNLQEFSASERIEQVEVDKKGNRGSPVVGTFSYVAEVREVRPGHLSVEEYRDGSMALQVFNTHLADTGTAAFALMFHPHYINDFSMQCEGLVDLQGQPTWQLRFMQSRERAGRFRVYRTLMGSYPVHLKGRAWVAADTHQVLRLETDIVQPVKEILLQREHLVINYRPVEFRKRHVRLWLPENAELYMDFSGHRYHRRHSFSEYQLFWVDVAEKIRDPEVR